jgi:DNA-binding NarL/FixJ family response regulator
MATLDGCIRILLVDDHPAIRRGLRHLLSACAEMDVVGEAASGESALRLAQSLTPDVVLLDVHLLNSSGFEVASLMRAVIPQAQIIMLTSFDGAGEADRAIASGANACLLKRDADECLAEMIRTMVRAEPISC